MTGSDEQLRVVLETARRYLRRNSNPLVRANAEDIAQEVGIKFIRASAAQDIENPAAWAITASRNLAINLINRNREVAKDMADEVNRGIFQFVAEGMATSYVAIIRQQVARLDAQLDDTEREFLDLVAEGYSHAEIAEIMGYKNANSVKATLHRKRAALAAAAEGAGLDADWQEHPRVSGEPAFPESIGRVIPALGAMVRYPRRGETSR